LRALAHARDLELVDDEDVVSFVALLLETQRLEREDPSLVTLIKLDLSLPDVSGPGRLFLALTDLRERADNDPVAARCCQLVDDFLEGMK
jgi:hypothetical protein